jgi:hypothetical protein
MFRTPAPLAKAGQLNTACQGRGIPQLSDIRNFLGDLLPRIMVRRTSENHPSTHSGE